MSMAKPSAKKLGLEAYGKELAAKRRKKLGARLATRLGALVQPDIGIDFGSHKHEDKCSLLRDEM